MIVALWTATSGRSIVTPGIAEWEDKALFILMEKDGEQYTATPYCDEEDLPQYFDLI